MLLLLVLLLFALLIYSNSRLAKEKGKNPFVWSFITLLAFFLSYGLLGGIYLSVIYKGPIDRNSLNAYLMTAPITVAMLIMLGVGGMLLVRFVLERSKGSDVGKT